MRNFLSFLQDPSLVCRFQSYFGVEKVAEIEHVKNGSWIATEIQENHPERKGVFRSQGGSDNISKITLNENGARSSKRKEKEVNGLVSRKNTNGKSKDHNIMYYRVSFRSA